MDASVRQVAARNAILSKSGFRQITKTGGQVAAREEIPAKLLMQLSASLKGQVTARNAISAKHTISGTSGILG